MPRVPRILPLVLLLAGCATFAGTAAAPVTSALGVARQYPPRDWYQWLAFPFAVAGGVVVGTAMAPAIGAWADYGALVGGEYGADGHPDLRDVFDPLGGH